MNNYHLFIVRYLSQTNTKPSRIQIESLRPINNGAKITFSYGSEMGTKEEEAIKILQSKGFNIIGTAESTGKISYIISDTFKTLS
jgi:hypothetical protein